jgi:hypothetical protein
MALIRTRTEAIDRTWSYKSERSTWKRHADGIFQDAVPMRLHYFTYTPYPRPRILSSVGRLGGEEGS